MVFNEQLPEWHATGVEPPESKKNQGWQPDDKPPADWFNWLFNRIYKVLVEIRNTLSGHVEDPAPHSGHETPDGATQKANAALTEAKGYTDGHAEKKDTHGAGSGYYLAKTSRQDQLPAWEDVQGKPSSYQPSAHQHTKSDISDFPISMTPSAHKTTHASGGSDALTPADIGAETPAGAQAKATAAASAALAAANDYTDQEVGEVAGDLASHLADNTPHREAVSIERKNPDDDGIFKLIEFRRPDGTLFKTSQLNGTNPYNSRTVKYYDKNENLMQTVEYSITYSNDEVVSEVIISA